MKYRYEPLATKVLAVAVLNFNENGKLRDWAAYIDAVPGHNHDEEYLAVAKMGTKLNPKIAGVIFPELDMGAYRL